MLPPDLLATRNRRQIMAGKAGDNFWRRLAERLRLTRSAPPVGQRLLDGPLVTVIICVYNAGAYLRPAVESILAQTYRNLEILVMNDGSTDGCLDTIAVLQDPRIRIIEQENQGKPETLNRAVAVARGEYYVIQDADDLSHPDRIERLLDCMLRHPRLAGVFSGYELMIGGRCVAPRFRDKDEVQCRREIEAFCMPGHDPTAMYRLALVKDYRYGPELRVVEGLDYILRVGEQHPLRVVGECLYTYRCHPNQDTKRNPEERQRLVRQVFMAAGQRRELSPATLSQLFGQTTRVSRNCSLDNNLATHFLESVHDLRMHGKIFQAIRTGWYCLGLHPLDPAYLRPFAYALLPLSVSRRLRRSYWRNLLFLHQKSLST